MVFALRSRQVMTLEVNGDPSRTLRLTTGFAKLPYLAHILDQIWLDPRMKLNY